MFFREGDLQQVVAWIAEEGSPVAVFADFAGEYPGFAFEASPSYGRAIGTAVER